MPAKAWFKLFIVLLILLFSNNVLYCNAASTAGISNIPEDSTKVLPFTQESSVSTFVPSTAAPGNGLAVNIIYPRKPRYKEGAPVVVVVPGGDAPSGLSFSVHAAQAGFIEIRFSFPGGGVNTFRSGGRNDYRGLKSQQALKDLLLFAAGKKEDFRHRTIANLMPIKVCTNNIGILGWSNGGNIALITLEKYATQLNFIKWLAMYECPLGSLFFPPSLGSTHDFVPNNHYRQGSAATGRCLIDFRQLAWAPEAHQDPGVHKKLGEPDLPGVVYFDDNQNGRWDESNEFAFAYCLDKGLNKKIFPPDVTAAMDRLAIFDLKVPKLTPVANTQDKSASDNSTGNKDLSDDSFDSNAAKNNSNSAISFSGGTKPITNNSPPTDKIDKVVNMFKAAGELKTKFEQKGFAAFSKAPPPKKRAPKSTVAQEAVVQSTPNYWPPTVATLEESEAYFQERDGSLSIPGICSSYPGLLVSIIAKQVDHLQSQPDHPHIILQYNTWLDNHAHWVRLNPEPVYLVNIANMGKSNFAQNLPNSALDATDITNVLEPSGALKDFVLVDAAMAELADRKQFKNENSPLLEPLYIYNNGVGLPTTKEENKNQSTSKHPNN